MDSFDTLKNIWHSEKAETLPKAAEITEAIKHYRKTRKRNVVLLLLAAVLLLPVLLAILFWAPINSWTTAVGEILMFAGLILTLILKVRTFKSTEYRESLPNDQFIESLKASLEQKPKRSRLQLWGFVCITLGYAFFIFESVKGDWLTLCLVYTAVLIFALGMYFFYRPFAQRKSQEKMKKLMEKVSILERQF